MQLVTSTGSLGPNVNLGPPSPGIKGRWPLRPVMMAAFWARLLVLDLPLRALAYTLLPHWTRQHRQWGVLRCILIAALKQYMGFTAAYNIFSSCTNKSILPRVPAKDNATAVWVQPINRQNGFKGEMATLFAAGGCTTARIPAYWVGTNHDGSKGSRNADAAGEKVILYFHGGGYKSQSGMPSPKGPMNNLRLLLRAAEKSSKKAKQQSPRRALSVEYRLTNETTFPGILADALAAWQYLVRDMHFAPSDIIIAGDSAGGNLALALARYLRDERPLAEECGVSKDGALADGLILLSPWCDLSCSMMDASASASGHTYESLDYLTIDGLRRAGQLAFRGLPADASTCKWLSPICTQRSIENDLFDGFPRALITLGGCELLADEIKELDRYYRAAAERGKAGQVTLHEEPLAPHDYGAIPFTFEKEHQMIVDSVAKWL